MTRSGHSFSTSYLHDFLFCRARLRSLGARVLAVVAVRTHASSSSSSPVSYISESVVKQPRDDDILLRFKLESSKKKINPHVKRI